jgi:hypothetical protein
MGTMLLPSIKHNMDVSVPYKNSSITILSPDLPNIFSSNNPFALLRASSLLLQTNAPFPAAKPSALTNTGQE